MADLSKMFGKKDDAAPASELQTRELPVPTQAAPTDPVDSAVVVETAHAEPTAPNPPSRKGLGFLGKGVAQKPDAVAKAASPALATQEVEKAKPKLASLGLTKPASVAANLVEARTQNDSGDAMELDLDALMNDETPAPTRVARPIPADHIEATAPTRPVPEDATPQMLSFVKLIDSVYDLQFDQELLGNVIKSIMIELQTNPIYISSDWKKSLVQPDDIRVWIRNMREVMGLNRIVKAEKKAKRASSKVKKVDSNEMLDDLASLGFSMDLG